MSKFRTIIFSSVLTGLALLTFTACGGGTTGPVISGPTVPGPVKITRAHALSTQSYLNAKNIDFFSEDFPRNQYGVNPINADARAFFRYPDGTQGLVVNILTYWQKGVMLPLKSATLSRIVFYRKVSGNAPSTWQEHAVSVQQQVQPCLHPRKILVADFNGDSVPDFAIMCHGWDAPPFPGERSTILLSQNGGYILKHLNDQADFYHGGSAADFNGDGIPDIVTATRSGLRVYINNGAGIFTVSSVYAIKAFRKAFHVELVDLNGDGHFDVVAGSHEWEDATRIIINPGNNQFNTARVVTIPAVPGAGTIVDFLHVPATNSLYILRTGDGKSNGTVFYQGLWLQKYSLTTGLSTVLLADPNWTDPRFSRPVRWLRWIVEKDGYIVSHWGNAIRVKVD